MRIEMGNLLRPSIGARRVILVMVAAACLVLFAAATAFAGSGSVRMIESNERYAFSPKTISVAVGDSITWTNASDTAHTVTSDTNGVIDSPAISDGETFKMTFNSAGTIAYHCTIHSYMHGTIQVLAAGAPPPATDTAAKSATARSDAGEPLVIVIVGALTLGLTWRRLAQAPHG
jgi:plastocyanin